MQTPLIFTGLETIPLIKPSVDIANLFISCLKKEGGVLRDKDIVCIASKIISVSQNKFIDITKIVPSEFAIKLHAKVPRKKPEVLELIFQEAGYSEEKIIVNENWVGALTKIGRKLTSAGIDTVDDSTVLLLPDDPDGFAKSFRLQIKEKLNVDIAVLITDSDGREDIKGATQLCIGLSGINPIRAENGNEETICDMLAAASGLIMGQRGKNIPVVIVSGYDFELDEDATLKNATA